MAKVYQFMADGFEDIEALAPVDILRRGGVEVTTVSITGSREVTSAHGVTLLADTTIEQAGNFADADLLLLPGGMPGSANLRDHEGVRQALLKQAERGGRIGAICAAPMVLGILGLLKGRRATCYPGTEQYLEGADYTAELVTVDGPYTTGRGPAAAFPYGYQLLSYFREAEAVEAIERGMIYRQLMES